MAYLYNKLPLSIPNPYACNNLDDSQKPYSEQKHTQKSVYHMIPCIWSSRTIKVFYGLNICVPPEFLC